MKDWLDGIDPMSVLLKIQDKVVTAQLRKSSKKMNGENYDEEDEFLDKALLATANLADLTLMKSRIEHYLDCVNTERRRRILDRLFRKDTD